MIKKFLLTFLFALMTIAAIAQTNNTIKFLGIPVDGAKSEMIQQLQKKGFRYDREQDVLIGRFNGKESNIRVSENYGKVDRIYIADADVVNEAQIIINYNNLLSQFKKNEKYVELEENVPIPSDEDVSYEMAINNKTYDAQFYVKPQWTDEQAAEMAKKAASIEDETERTKFLIGEVINNLTGVVWFRIADYYGKYYICLYYDNLLNRPNGEDL